MTKKIITELSFDIPKIFRLSDVKKAEKSLREVMKLIGPVQAKIKRAERELLMVHAIKMVEGFKGLERISVIANSESDDEGGSHICLSVECYHNDEDDYDESTSEELYELLIDATDDIYDSELGDSDSDPKAFISGLATALFGEENANEWFAAREAAEISDATKKTTRSVKVRSL